MGGSWLLMTRSLILIALTASAAAIHPLNTDLRLLAKRAIMPYRIYTAAGKPEAKPPGFLKQAYAATGLATTGAWTTVVWTTIRSNQPMGAMMPSWQHGVFARLGALSAVPLIASCFATLASKADSWETLGSDTCRRLNLALVASGVGSALWVNFADVVTRIPGQGKKLAAGGVYSSYDAIVKTAEHVCHQSYKATMRAALIGSYGSAAVLGAAVWVHSLPSEVRAKPLTWPGRIVDGVCKSLVSLAPTNLDDATNVKYSILTTSFLLFTALQLHSFPTAVIPSWTGRRCSRAFPAWTLLAAVTSFNLKEARESGQLFNDPASRLLSNGLAGLGAVYLSARVGAVFLDPSFPVHYGLVKQVPAWAAASAAMIGLTLRPDEQPTPSK
jgi:hypothetical protein